jgi:Sec-independent protein translocase protein TatA
MDIFGIGFPELLLIFVIALIVLGPRNMVSTSKQISDAVRKFITSDTWKSVINSSHEIRDFQEGIIKDTGLSETIQAFQESTRGLVSPSLTEWNSTGIHISSSSIGSENNMDIIDIPKPVVNNMDVINQSSVKKKLE